MMTRHPFLITPGRNLDLALLGVFWKAIKVMPFEDLVDPGTGDPDGVIPLQIPGDVLLP